MTEQELKLAIEHATGEKRIELMHQLGHIVRFKDQEEALELAYTSLDLAKTINSTRAKAFSLLAIAGVHYATGNLTLWKKHIFEAERFLENNTGDELDLWFRTNKGHLLYMEGELETALDLFLALEYQLDRIDINSFYLIRAYAGTKAYLGMCWIKVNNPLKALECFNDGYDLITIKQPQYRWPTFLSCRALIALGEFEKARAIIYEWINSHPDIIDKDNGGVGYLLMIEAYIKEEEWAKALEASENTKRAYERANHEITQHWLYWHQFCAIACRNLGQINEAYDHIQKALEFCEHTGINLSKEELLLELGLIKFEMQEVDTALQALEEALLIVKQSGNRKVSRDIFKGLSEIYQSTNQFDLALSYLKQAQELEREEWRNSNSMAVSAVERQHKVEQEMKDAEIYRLRNVELAEKNEKLIELNSQKDQLMEQRRELMRIAIHDLRSPLTNISLYSQLLDRQERANANAAKLKSIEKIQTSVFRMSELLDRLLSSDRFEDGDIELIQSEGDLHRSVAKVLEQFSEAALAKSIQIKNTILPGTIKLYTDLTLLQQILANLVSNGIKFSEPGTEILILSEKRGETICIEVVDEGQGFSVADTAKMFSRYQRLSAKPTAGETSTGLGLHIAQKLTHALGGRIEAHSDGPGEGATFEIILPAAPNITGLDSLSDFSQGDNQTG